MRWVVLFLCIFVTLIQGCGTSGSGGCNDAVVIGSWRRTILGSEDILTFSESCQGASSYCESTFSFPNVISTVGDVLITITSTVGKTGCLPLGDHICSYVISGGSLVYNCGGGTVEYEKQ